MLDNVISGEQTAVNVGRLARIGHSVRDKPRVAVVQDGARLHYALPVALQQAGLLEKVFTDWWVTPGSLEQGAAGLLQWLSPGLSRRMADRQCEALDPRRVFRNPLLAICQQVAKPRFRSDEDFYEWSAQQVARWVQRSGWGRANTLFGFVRNVHPQLCKAARHQGFLVVGDQMIAPAAVERRQFHRERERWPGWQVEGVSHRFRLVQRIEEKTWELLHHVTCASEYVRQGLVAQGVNPARISVIPYPIDLRSFPARQQNQRSRALVVGFVGAVGMRKGVPYFLEVARRLGGRGLRFVMAGPVVVGGSALQDLKRHVELTGAFPRSQIQSQLSQFDIFLFPSTCEGSAGSVMEAMASGLPVVTSPESGSVIADGLEGFVCAYDDVDGLANRVTRLAEDAVLRDEMGRAARRRVESFDVANYAVRLGGLLIELWNERGDFTRGADA